MNIVDLFENEVAQLRSLQAYHQQESMRLLEENRRLREALERVKSIAGRQISEAPAHVYWRAFEDVLTVAREALKS